MCYFQLLGVYCIPLYSRLTRAWLNQLNRNIIPFMQPPLIPIQVLRQQKNLI